MRPRAAILALVLLGAARAHGGDVATDELLRGARAFRAGQYEAALAAFEHVAARGGAPELAIYLGPTLYKLGRFDEARQLLGRLQRSGAPDVVAQYYLGLTYYRQGYLALARAAFAALDARAAGPKLATGARQFVDEIDRLRAQAAPAAGAAALERFLASAADPAAALDGAEEAFLRAPPGSPAQHRAAELVLRAARPGDVDAVARAAALALGRAGAAP